MKNKFLVDERRNKIMEMARRILRASGAKNVNELIVSIKGKEEVAISGDVPIGERPIVLAEISAALKEGEGFFHAIKKGFLVICPEKTKEETIAEEKKLKSGILKETLEGLEIDMVPA